MSGPRTGTRLTPAGTGALARLALRRDRGMLAIWLAALVGSAVGSAGATVGLYPTATSRAAAAQTINASPALVAVYGRIYDPTSLGAVAMIKLAGPGAALVGVLAVILIVRHTRAEEEAGRAELIDSAVVGRHAALTAALMLASATNLGLGLATAVGLAASGLPIAGSIAFGLGWTTTGLAFAGVAAVAAQLTRTARAATGLGLAALAIGYLLRAVGDTARSGGPIWSTWLSPIGWEQQVRPYAGDRWWVLLAPVLLAVATSGAAFALRARRDLAAGLLPDRPGPVTAGSGLRSPLALAWRLQRGTLAAWAAGFALIGTLLGSAATNVTGLADSAQVRELLVRLGGRQGLTDAFLATELGFAGIIAAVYGIQAAGRIRAEEEAGRAEPLLATAASRTSWLLGHATTAVLGTAGLLGLLGAVGGLGYAEQTAQPDQVGRVLAAALIQIPAACVLVALVVAVAGWFPGAASAGWVALAAVALVGELGPLVSLPQPVLDLSPFAHTPRLPGGRFDAAAVAWLITVALALAALGVVGIRRRDIR